MFLELFCKIISESCFDILRTKEQLGTVCSLGIYNFESSKFYKPPLTRQCKFYASLSLGYIVVSGVRRSNGVQVCI